MSSVIVGLTGGIASGKSTVTQMFRELGAYVVDADVWARRVVEPGSPALAEIAKVFEERFETLVLNPDGTLNRGLVGKVVFYNEQARQALNSLTHPRIRQGMREETEQFFLAHPDAPIIWDVPLLFEGETRQLVDVTILVYSDEATQRLRLMHRDRLNEADAMARIRSQMAIEEKRQLADYIVNNMGSMEETREQVQRIWNTLQGQAKEGRARTFAADE